eukprot:849791-Pleurochrysis_carterae.AAC.3
MPCRRHQRPPPPPDRAAAHASNSDSRVNASPEGRASFMREVAAESASVVSAMCLHARSHARSVGDGCMLAAAALLPGVACKRARVSASKLGLHERARTASSACSRGCEQR